MGKLGKKARKFAKKNLPSVLRDRRKKKALFKKRYSSSKYFSLPLCVCVCVLECLIH